MSKLPAFQFYVDDWLSNSKLQLCSMSAQGLMINLMCHMHKSEEYGKLLINGSIPNHKTIIKLLRMHHRTFIKALSELTLCGVLKEDEQGVLYCRRMIEDNRLRDIRRQAGKQGGNPYLVKQRDKQDVKQKTTPSSPSSSTSSTSPSKEKIKTCPEVDELPSAPEELCFITLPLNDKAEYPIYLSVISELKELFQAVDVHQEFRNMKGWLNADPKRRKTARGIKRFYTGWLSRAQDKYHPTSKPPNTIGVHPRGNNQFKDVGTEFPDES